MSRSVLQSILGDAVYQSLSSEIKNALEDYLGLKNNAITNLEAEIQKIKADYGKLNGNRGLPLNYFC